MGSYGAQNITFMGKQIVFSQQYSIYFIQYHETGWKWEGGLRIEMSTTSNVQGEDDRFYYLIKLVLIQSAL